jgi:hypothetical protein
VLCTALTIDEPSNNDDDAIFGAWQDSKLKSILIWLSWIQFWFVGIPASVVMPAGERLDSRVQTVSRECNAM